MDRAGIRWYSVWRRNALAWQKSACTALLGGFVEPLLYLLALGYGLGVFIHNAEEVSYSVFLTSGILSSSAMNAATFEGLYLAYTRMEVLRTWDGMLSAPLDISDIVIGEVLWMGTKSMLSAGLILLVTTALKLTVEWSACWVLLVTFVAGLCFGGMALLVTSFARSYQFFVYYITLVITPMTLLSGVFFPFLSLPVPIRAGMVCLPLYHLVETVRSLTSGHTKIGIFAHIMVLILYTGITIRVTIWQLQKRLLS